MIIHGSKKQLAKQAAEIITERIEGILKNQKLVVLAVPGGRSVAGIFENLKKEQIPWQQIRLFLLDERLVPLDDPESNYRLVNSHLGDLLPEGALHPFKFDPQNPAQGAAAYEEQLQGYGGRFDIVVASSGEDGHIGSIFPHHQVLKQDKSGFTVVNDSPKPPAGRMTATPALIGTADTGVLLFLGEAKKDALADFLDPGISSRHCPAKIFNHIPCHYVLTDQEVDQS